MKSIYLLCEYGVAYSTVKKLKQNDISIEDVAFNSSCLDGFWGKTSKKKMKILSVIKDILSADKEDSVFSLIDFGLSNILAELLFEKNIRVSEIYNMNEEKAKTEYGIKGDTFSKISKAIEKYYKYKPEHVKSHGYPYFVYDYIKTTYHDKKATKNEIKLGLERLNYDVTFLDEDLNYLISNKKLLCENQHYFVRIPMLSDIINELKENDKKIIMLKFQGKTLEAIGLEQDISKEGIRQKVKKIIDKMPSVYEDKYASVFSKYDFNRELFCTVFGVDESVYYYLKEKYVKGKQHVLKILDTDELDNSKKVLLEEKCKELKYTCLKSKEKIIEYKNECVKANKLCILEAILKHQDSCINIDKIIFIYNEVIRINKLERQLRYLKSSDQNSIEGLFSRSNKVVLSISGKYRYYDFGKLTEVDIIRLRNLLNVESGVYSTKLFIDNNPLLMDELNIKNEYELHNILRKLFSSNKNFNFSRMPSILINCNSKLDFIESKIKELSPINLDGFCKFMYKNYGHKPESEKAFLFTNFGNYINNGVLIYDSPRLTLEQEQIIKKYLTDDIYYIDDINQKLINLLNVNDSSLINKVNLFQMGYKIRGSYVVKNNFTSAEMYYREHILSTDYYTVEPEHKKKGTSYERCLWSLSNKMDIFKISNDKYITIKKLNSLGITKEDIVKFKKQVISLITDDKYFDLSFIKDNMPLNNLDKKELNDFFFENIISMIPGIKTVMIGKIRIFVKCQYTPTLSSFINSIINKKGKIKIEELKQYLKEKYGVNIVELDLIDYVIRESFYYQDNTGYIYSDPIKLDEEVKHNIYSMNKKKFR